MTQRKPLLVAAALVLLGLVGGCCKLPERFLKKEGPPPEASTKPSPRAPLVTRKFRELPGPDHPARGNSNAPVTIQEFANFECSFSRKAEENLQRVLHVYQGKVRIVWRHRMLPFHRRAPLASEVAVEIYKQKGPAYFWTFFREIATSTPEHGLQRSVMEGYAKKMGVDMDRLRQALDAKIHQAVIQEDTRMAEELGFPGTPTFLISATGKMEGYVLEGAQTFVKFEEAINRALEDARVAPEPP